MPNEAIEILLMTERDLKAVSEIEKLSGLSVWGIKNYKSELERPDAFLFVAKKDGKIIGFVSARLITPVVEIFNIAVLPEFRKQGIGGKLFGEILIGAVKNGAKVCWLEVRESNKTARKFYENLKFENVGKRKNYYTNPAEDSILLEFKIGD